MDVTQQTMLETLFNVAGFLLASGLWMLFYSKTQKREKIITKASTIEEKPTHNESQISSIPKNKLNNIEFLSLKAASRQGETVTTSNHIDKATNSNGVYSQAEIIRMARKMLQSGKSYDDIKRKLPITDGELALLQIA